VANKKKVRANGEGHIRKRTDRRSKPWEGVYKDPITGKPKSIYCTTQAEVTKKLREIRGSIENGTYIENPNLTLGEWLTQWLEVYAKPKVRISTYASYETYVNRHIIPVLGKIKLKDLRKDTLQRFLNEKHTEGRIDKKGGLSAKTIKNLRNMIHSALQQACDNDLIHKNASEKLSLPEHIKKEIEVFGIEEQRRLQDASKNFRLGIGIILSLYTGIRVGELLGLWWSDIDLQGEILHVRRILQRVTVHDDSNHKTKIIIGEPKTAKGRRIVPLPPFLIPLLIKFKKQQQEESLLFGQDYITAPFNGDFVIRNEYGKYIEPRTYQDFFKRVQKEAGIPILTTHACRHTFATRALENNNFDIKTLSTILGHASVLITLDLYGHSLFDHQRKLMGKFNELWEGGL